MNWRLSACHRLEARHPIRWTAFPGRRAGGLLAMLAALLSVAPGSGAGAAPCGEFTADGGDNLIIVGVAAREVTLPGERRIDPPTRLVAPVVPLQPGICWRRGDGEFELVSVPGCHGRTAEDDRLLITALAGDDTIVPVVGDERLDPFRCPVSRLLGGDGYLLPLDDRFLAARTGPSEPCRDRHGCPAFRFGLDVRAGSGNDVVFGSPADDRLYSNVVEQRTIRWNGRRLYVQFFPEDGQTDVLCGYNGDDVLFADIARSRRHGTCFMAGPGTDSCRGHNGDHDINVFGDCEDRRQTGVDTVDTDCAAMCSARQLNGVAAPPDPDHLMTLR